MENEKLFDLMTKMYSEMQNGFKEVRNEITDIKSDLGDVKRTVINIEQNHGQKLEALFDGYTQNNSQLDIVDDKVDTLQKSVNDLKIRTIVTDNKLIDLSRKVR